MSVDCKPEYGNWALTPPSPPPAHKQTTDSDVAKLFGEDAQIAYGFGSVFDEVRRSRWFRLG